MTSSCTAAFQVRARMLAGLGLLVAAFVVGLIVTTSAQAHHRPDDIAIIPNPPVPVPDTVTTTSAALGGLRLPIPPTLPDAPDLIPIMPEITGLPYNVPAFYIDTVESPGNVFYRFDAVLGNVGGAFDLFCQNCSSSNQAVFQAIWPGGRPPGPQIGFSAPSGTTNHDLTAKGATMIYSNAFGHDHWHYNVAATYEFLIPGAASIPTVKIGFCMLDTYDTISGPNYYGSGQPWCMAGNTSASFVRMGISPGIGDYYNAQLADQWIDVTGITPGTYTLRAEVNPPRPDINPSTPPRIIVEHDTTNNVGDFPREIPGAAAAGSSLSTQPGQALDVGLAGTLVGPDVKSRKPTCTHSQRYNASCYEDATGDTSIDFAIDQAPANGTLSSITTTGDTTATVTYTPNPGFVGVDTFTYTATDSRGLGGVATARVAVGNPPAPTAAPTVSGSAVVGETLNAAPGSWTGDGEITFSYQWQRCDAAGTGCVGMAGSVAPTYVVSSDDVGATLRVNVTATSPVAAVFAPSAVTAVVTVLPVVKDRKSKLVRLLIVGSKFADYLNGTGQHELFRGLGGPDLIEGRGGSDLGYGGNGRDSMNLGSGRDIAHGGKGRDTLKLGGGPDIGHGGRGADLIIGGNGKDKLYGENGADTIRARDGKVDVVNCGKGRDTVIADAKDRIHKNCEIVKLPGSKATTT